MSKATRPTREECETWLSQMSHLTDEAWSKRLVQAHIALLDSHEQTIQERYELHEAIHKTGTCPIAGCKGVDDYKQKIFTHKHLDIECIEKGCQSLFLDELRSQLAETIQLAKRLEEALNRIKDIPNTWEMDPMGGSSGAFAVKIARVALAQSREQIGKLKGRENEK